MDPLKSTDTPLCYLQAYQALQAGAISWERYIHDLLLHAITDLHDGDDSRHPGLRKTDPFGYSLWKWRHIVRPYIRNISELEAPFLAYEAKADVHEPISALERYAVPYVRQSLCFLALQRRDANMMEECLTQGGFSFDGYFREEAYKIDVQTDPEVFQVLERSLFRKQCPRLQVYDSDSERERSKQSSKNDGISWKDDAAWRFDALGIYP